jgi:hypothetical protein
MNRPAIVWSSRNEIRAVNSPASNISGVLVTVMSAVRAASVCPRPSKAPAGAMSAARAIWWL